MNKKKTIILIVVIALAILLTVIGIKLINKPKTNDTNIDEVITKIGNDYYEKVLYKTVNKEVLEVYKEEGFKIVLVTIKDNNLISKEDLELLKEYDFENTRIIYYPTNPYGNKDYTMEIEKNKSA